uniref:Rps3_b n=1 Tax=Oxytricha trifallax TaxID=1172189 RepID=G9HRI3_9SPIT|nr:rps3_b [Oxytricha trifallax]
MIVFFFYKPVFFKSYYFFIFKSFLNTSYLSFFYSLIRKDENVSFFQNANIFPEKSIFSFNVTREVIQNMDYSKIQSFFSYLPYETIIKFIEHCSGKKVAFKIDPFVMKSILPEDNSRCFMWSHRIKVFRKNLGPRLFLVESLQILTLCFRLKDPYVLSNWMLSMFYKISFWKYKMFFRYIQYILRNFFWPYFSEYGIKGVRFQLKGKVSVAGNARTRTIFAKIGSLSHSTYKYKILTHLNLLRTFTGVIGFRTWLIF